jgi:hypothetical protein
MGSENPETEKPGPDAEILEIFSAALPGFEIVTACELLTPTAIFPKSKLVGFTDIAGCPCDCDAPAALNGTTALETEELLAKVMLPEILPVLVGVTLAMKDML